MSASKSHPEILPTHEFRKRKFPGPAGLPPRRIKDPHDTTQNEPGEVSTQMEKIQSLLKQSPWLKLVEHLCDEDSKHGLDSEACRPIKSMNIKWIQTKAYRLPMCMKVPFLAAVLENAPQLPSNRLGKRQTPCVKLIDESGTIAAAIDANFVKEHEAKLVPGTALALTNAGILRWKSKRGAILTVTKNNVLFIAYNKNVTRVKSSTEALTPPSSLFSIPEIVIESVQPYVPQTIMEDYQRLMDPAIIMQQYREMEKESQESISHNTAYYNTTCDDYCSEYGNNEFSSYPSSFPPKNNNHNNRQLFTRVQQQQQKSMNKPYQQQQQQQPVNVNSYNSNNNHDNVSERTNSQDAEDSFQEWDEDDELFRTFDMELY